MKNGSKISLYPIVIEPCEEGGYFAHCPTLPGCHAEGETFGQVIDTIQDVIKAHVELREKHHEVIPMVQIKEMSSLNFQIPLPVMC